MEVLNEHVLGGGLLSMSWGGGGGGGGIGLNVHVLGEITEFVPGGGINFTCLGGLSFQLLSSIGVYG